MSTKYVTISVKLPREIKEKLEKAGKKPGRIAKEALIRAVEEIELEEIKKSIKELQKTMEKISPERITESIREDRER
jgi:predicted DNA-binding protein